jgi:hypothetical protein
LDFITSNKKKDESSIVEKIKIKNPLHATWPPPPPPNGAPPKHHTSNVSTSGGGGSGAI